ncbi:MAG TPA: carotenoid biosynthesis protein [Blastocatellia bacterium]|jgi:putative membrane protein
MILRKTALMILLAVYALMWVGGVGSHVWFESAPAQTAWAAPAFLLLAGVIVIVTSRRGELASLLAASLLGFIAEVVGVCRGFLFGDYVYTNTLGPQLFGVPLVMAIAWMVLVAYVRQMLMRFSLPAWVEASIAALWMTAIDLVIDPLAAGALDYWRWGGAGVYYGVPASNFAGWLGVSLLIFGTIGVLFGRGRQSNAYACRIGLSIILFFTAIALAHSLTLVGAIGMSLCAAHLTLHILPLGHEATETNRW